MENCLVTKLKASVNNPDLDKLGYLRIARVHLENETQDMATIQVNRRIQLGETITFEIDGDGYFMDTYGGASIGKTKVVAYGQMPATFYSSNGNYNIFVTQNVDFSALGIGNTLDISKLYYTDATKVGYQGMYGQISTLNVNKIKQLIAVSNTNIKGTFEDFVNLTGLTLFDLRGTVIQAGDLKKCVFTQLNTQYLPISFQPGMSGSVEEWVAALRAAGVTEKESLRLQSFNELGTITFNGSTIVATPTIKVLSWTANTITWDGVTIDA